MKCIKKGCDGEFEVKGYCKQMENIYMRTRVCNKCGFKTKTVEMTADDYNKAVRLMEAMRDIVKEFA